MKPSTTSFEQEHFDPKYFEYFKNLLIQNGFNFLDNSKGIYHGFNYTFELIKNKLRVSYIKFPANVKGEETGLPIIRNALAGMRLEGYFMPKK